MSRKNLWIGAGIVLVVGTAVLFRGAASRIINFGKTQDQTSLPASASLPQTEAPGKSSVSDAVSTSVSRVPTVTPQPAPSQRPQSRTAEIRPYAGRDPAEVRPAPDEVKVFSEEQKAKLYAAIGRYGALVKANPTDYNGWMQVGLLKKEIGDFEGARDAWEYATVAAPSGYLPFANLGDLFWRYLRDYPKSEQNLKIAAARKPDDIGVWTELSDLYYYSYKEKAAYADQALLEGLKNNPDDDTLMRHLARLYEMRGRDADALTWWEKIAAFNPTDQQVTDKIKTLKEKLGTAS